MGPTNIISLIGDKSFEQVSGLLSEPPYCLSVSDEDDMYMLNFTGKSDLTNPVCREANGIILQKDTNKLLHYSFAKTYDGLDTNVTVQDPDNGDLFKCDKMDANNNTIVKNGQELPFSIQLFTEGSLIKVFYHDFEWKIATSHKINAAFSHGRDKSFKEMFYEAFDEVEMSLSDLADEFCYTFILQHPENHICLDIQVPFVSMINKVNLIDYSETNLAQGYLVDKPLSYYHDTTDTNLLLYIGEDRVKILCNTYLHQKKMLGNHSNINYIYLNCIQNGAREFVRDSLKSKTALFDSIDKRISDEINLIFHEYRTRHIERKRMDILSRHRKIIYELHGDYLKTSTRVSKFNISDKLLSLPTRHLLRVLDL